MAISLKILDAVANNELKVSVDAIDEKTLVVGFQKVANRITVGLIIAALIVGAAMMMRVETKFQIWGYPGLNLTLPSSREENAFECSDRFGSSCWQNASTSTPGDVRSAAFSPTPVSNPV